MAVIKLNELARSQREAIDDCISLGKQFLNHFNKIVSCEDPINDVNFSHHCDEMQTWYDQVRKYKLKTNNKLIPKIKLIDWFFTASGDVEDYVDEDHVSDYEELVGKLLFSNSNVEEILTEILSDRG